MSHISKLDWKEVEGLESMRTPEGRRINCINPDCWDTGFHCYLNTKKMVFHCFKCGSGGTIKKSYMLRIPTMNVLQRLLRRKPPIQPPIQPPVRRIVKTLPRHSEKIPDDVLKYLYTRGLTDREIEDNELMYAIDDIYVNSVIFPCTLVGTTCDYFVCRKLPWIENNGKRVIEPDEVLPWKSPKYINASWPKGDTLYQPVCHGEWKGTIAIVEGPFDAIATTRVLPTVALLGKEANQEQLSRLKELRDDFLIMLDSDAYSYAMKLAIKLGRGRIVRLPSGKDPGSMLSTEIQHAIGI